MTDPFDALSSEDQDAILDSWKDTSPPSRDPLDTSGLTALSVGCDLGDVAECLKRLRASLNGTEPLARRVLRNQALAELKRCRVQDAANLVDAAFSSSAPIDADGVGESLALETPELWPEPVDGTDLFTAVDNTIRRYVALGEHEATAATLWVFFAHSHDAFQVSPLLSITSPQPECGKSTLLAIIAALTPRALSTANISTAALFRAVDAFNPTLCIDEADTAGLHDRDELRGILNSGHLRPLATTARCVGDDHEVRTFKTWCPKTLALIGDLPATLRSRAIVLRLRRRLPTEHIEPLRLDRLHADLTPLRRQLARWAADHAGYLAALDPDVPPGLHDRAADNWRPLLAIAQTIGLGAPALARQAAKTLGGPGESDAGDPGVELLADLRGIFGKRERLKTAEMLTALHALDLRRWPTYSRGKPITPHAVAKLLKRFGIEPDHWRDGEQTVRGYLRAAFLDAWDRYLVDPPPDPEQSGTSGTSGTDKAQSGGIVSDVPDVPDDSGLVGDRQRIQNAREDKSQRDARRWVAHLYEHVIAYPECGRGHVRAAFPDAPPEVLEAVMDDLTRKLAHDERFGGLRLDESPDAR